ncbi:hypothetical protein [Aestuariimicrobium sp. Y1814]|uniref:hypothetical protein n=1 Tax=Aestuariimicrobium sp. Y1814 TaxID=3418742 RepID=UPI003DA6E441
MTDNMTMTRRERRVQRLADLVAERKAFEAELVAKKAAIEAEERADAKAVKDALKYAGEARCAAVEELYELFGITEEVTERMTKDGTVRRVRKDRGEAKRAARLVEAVVALKARAAASEAASEAEEPVLEDGETVADGGVHEDDDEPEEREDTHERGFSVYGA